ncbi:hypothetical protein ACFE04_022664 [Oxalis oulophora]
MILNHSGHPPSFTSTTTRFPRKLPPATCTPNNVITTKTQKNNQHLNTIKVCPCCVSRRHFLEAVTVTTLLPTYPSRASDSNYTNAMLNKVHPQRPDWYEEFYASVLDSGMKAYEAEVAGLKTRLFSNLKGKAKNVMEIGIGTGPNLQYYAGGGDDDDVKVFGLDPNEKMEKYAQAAAVAAGLRQSNFDFIHAFVIDPLWLVLELDSVVFMFFCQVGEAIPLSDASVDAVIGTLVLCSVTDVDLTLQEVKRVLRPGGLYLFVEHVAAKDGTGLKLLQNVLDPLQQTVADGCHLTRKTGRKIYEAGFSDVDLKTFSVSNAFFINPHIYGVACK